MEPDRSDVPPLYLLLARSFGDLSVRVCLPLAPGVHISFLRFGFSVNFSPGKSEAIVYYLGVGSQQLRRHIEVELASVVRMCPV